MQRIRKNDGQRNSVARGSSVIGASQRAVAIFSSSEPSRGTVKVQNANKTGFSAVSHPSNHSPSTGATIYTHNQRSSLTLTKKNTNTVQGFRISMKQMCMKRMRVIFLQMLACKCFELGYEPRVRS